MRTVREDLQIYRRRLTVNNGEIILFEDISN